MSDCLENCQELQELQRRLKEIKEASTAEIRELREQAVMQDQKIRDLETQLTLTETEHLACLPFPEASQEELLKAHKIWGSRSDPRLWLTWGVESQYCV